MDSNKIKKVGLCVFQKTRKKTKCWRYLHQLCEEIHGYCSASVEEHGSASQEA